MFLLPNDPTINTVVTWIGQGILHFSGWQMILFTLVVTHLTIVSVTVFLHRHQAHRALDLHAIPSHFFRFWLWMTTGMVTKEWVAVHRKHHAKCETEEDPHSPQTRGIKTVFWQGAELYRAEAKNLETIQKYGSGTPNDWLERNLYSRFSWQGVALFLLIDLALFGGYGAAIWAVQMMWIPIMAAGVINGIGHYWGYRNFQAPDTSTNISPWGLIIGGEELHNNHHTYPTSAKFSVKPYEFDLGWVYISLMKKIGWAKVKKIPPKLKFGSIQNMPHEKTLEALIAHRYEWMAAYTKAMKLACQREIRTLQARKIDASPLKQVRRWLHWDTDRMPSAALLNLKTAREAYPALDKMLQMREELRQFWVSTSASREQLAADLQAWCHRAEASGIAALRDLSLQLRAAKAN